MDDFTKFGIDINHITAGSKPGIKQLGSVTKAIFDSFVEAGFNEDQALKLTLGIINGIQIKIKN